MYRKSKEKNCILLPETESVTVEHHMYFFSFGVCTIKMTEIRGRRLRCLTCTTMTEKCHRDGTKN
jgi:hypothetical protein